MKFLEWKKTEIVMGSIYLVAFLGQPEITFDPITPEMAELIIKFLASLLPITLGARLKRMNNNKNGGN